MNRDHSIKLLKAITRWDIVVIGGGATGLGVAVDAASRGFKTLLIEQTDFAKGTSSRSTKLVHGGVRYLQQGNIKLVTEALKERAILLKNAPHVCRKIGFIIPAFRWWEKFYYGTGLKIYDLLSGKSNIGHTRILSRTETAEYLPAIPVKNLKGGIIYYDGQFDDSRLALNLAATATEQGASLINYCSVVGFLKKGNIITGVELHDELNNNSFRVHARAVINATGVFTDQILKLDNSNSQATITASQGVHLVFNQKHFPAEVALMIPKTSDGRVLFVIPWNGKIIVGTTDTPVSQINKEPLALKQEIDFILGNLNLYLEHRVTPEDILSIFTGLRPLVKQSSIKKTALLPRDHVIIVSSSGLLSITGGKWTTYRKMAAQVIDKAIAMGRLQPAACRTSTLKIHGHSEEDNGVNPLAYYGSDLEAIKGLYKENSDWESLLHPDLPYPRAAVVFAARNEMAQTVEDVLARRTRALFLDAKISIAIAPLVAEILAREMGKDELWIDGQLKSFYAIAKNYIP